jgi:RimJ/RimL family protein N-acetyltransferase
MTARLRLRPYDTADFEAVVRDLILDPAVHRFWHDYVGPAITDDERRAMADVDFADWIEDAIAAGYPAWTIEPVDLSVGSPGVFVGVTGLFPPEGDEGPEPELGIMLAGRYHGRGLATEAIRAVLDDGFGRLGLLRVAAVIDAPNVASIRMVEKVGFALEQEYVGQDDHPYRRYLLEAPVSRA